MAPPEWHHRFTCQTARQPSVSAPGNRSAPGRRPFFARLETRSRRVKRRKALVRKPPHPVATLRSGRSLQRKGRPAHDADRRALRRFTTVFVRPCLTTSGRRLPPGSLPATGGPAGSQRTGRSAHRAGSEASRESGRLSRTRRHTVPASAKQEPSGMAPLNKQDGPCLTSIVANLDGSS